MTPSEVTALCTYVAVIKPSHKFDADACQMWWRILADVRVEDARLVVDELLRSQEWIGPNDIVQAVKRLRRDRLARHGYAELTPNVAPLLTLDDGRTVENPAHRAEKLALRDAIASGEFGPTEVEAYRRGEVPPLTGGPALVSGPLVTRRLPALEGVTRRAQ